MGQSRRALLKLPGESGVTAGLFASVEDAVRVRYLLFADRQSRRKGGRRKKLVAVERYLYSPGWPRSASPCPQGSPTR